MILNYRTEQERDILRDLWEIINLRDDSRPHRPIIDDTPWCRVVKPNPKYL